LPVAALYAAVLAVSGCASSPETAAPPEIRLVVPGGGQSTGIEVAGLPAAELAGLRAAAFSAEEWAELLRVSVEPGGEASGTGSLPGVLGSYAATGEALVFTPRFGLDPGRPYRAEFDPRRLPGARGSEPWRQQPIVAVLVVPKPEIAPSTVVTRTYPSTGVVPENQLRLYVHFSAPMGLQGGLGYIRLLDATGDEVRDPFLPLDVEFWNGDRTRYTLFFDPGRVKRGILPNELMGRSLVAGRTYTLVISRDWRDANGLPLKEEFRRQFRVASPDEAPLTTGTWRLTPPRAHTRDALVVTFPEPLDHGLLLRALGVTTAAGVEVDGDIRIEADETRWIMNPDQPWAAGDYRLLALTFLEDLAGNRIGRAFEVDRFERADNEEPESVNVPFRVDAAPTQ
jgi:hypothetical protein